MLEGDGFVSVTRRRPTSPSEPTPPGPGWHLWTTRRAIGYFGEHDWIETFDLPASVASNPDAELLSRLAESGVAESRLSRSLTSLRVAEDALRRCVLRLTSPSAFTNAFVASARTGFTIPLATATGVTVVERRSSASQAASLGLARTAPGPEPGPNPWGDIVPVADPENWEALDSGVLVVTYDRATFAGARGNRSVRAGRL